MFAIVCRNGDPAAPARDLELAALAGQQRPRPADRATAEVPGRAVGPLAVAVEAVALPYGAAGGRGGQRRVCLWQRRQDRRVVGRLDAEPHELEEARIDDLLVEVEAGAVGQLPAGVVVRVAVVVDAHVVPPVTERPRRREHPLLGAALPRVRNAQPQRLARRVAAPAGEIGRRDEAGDLRRGRRRREPAGLFPAFLRRRRPEPHERVGSLAHALPGVRVSPAELPCEHDRERRLVELDVALVRLPADARVLRERSVGLLLMGEQPRHGPVGRGAIARREHCGRLVIEVARPHEVVAAPTLVGVHRESPGQRERGDEGAAEALVLVRLDRHDRDLVLRPQPIGQERRRAPHRAEIAAPLLPVGPRHLREPLREAVPGDALGGRRGVGEPERERELRRRSFVERQLAGLEHVAVRGRVVVEVQPHVLLEVRPAVARPDESARRSLESARRDQGAGRRPLRSDQRDVAAAAAPRSGCHGARSCPWRGRGARTAGSRPVAAPRSRTRTSTLERSGSVT